MRVSLLFFLPPLLLASPNLQVAQSGGVFKRGIPYPDGSGTLMVGAQRTSMGQNNTRQALTLIKLNSSGTTSYPSAAQLFGQGNDVPADAAFDKQGNIWIVGTTDSDDFPLVHPVVSQKVPYRGTGFVTEIDPTGQKILFSSFLGGQQKLSYPILNSASEASSLAIDSSGNVAVVGTTTEPDFPQTASILGSGMPITGDLDKAVFTFLVRIAPTGQLLSSVLFGGKDGDCQGGSHCIGHGPYTLGTSIAVQANGTITIAGATNVTKLPVTPQAFQTHCLCLDLTEVGFVARFSSTGTNLIWATYFGYQGTDSLSPFSSISSLALDHLGNVYVAGQSQSGFFTTPGVLQPTVPARSFVANPFVAKLSADGSSVSYSTYLTGTFGATLNGLTLDSAENVWVSGTTTSTDFPSLPKIPQLGNDFVLELSHDASALTQIYRLSTNTVSQPVLFDRTGALLLISSQGTVLHLDSVNGMAGSGILAVTNAASLAFDTGFEAGSLTTLFGVGLGPSPGLTASLDANGKYPTELGGVQVLIGGKPSPLLYVGPNQINFQVPFVVPDYAIQVITSNGTKLPAIRVNLNASPSLFHRPDGSAAALNQDGTINSVSNRAIAGSVVSLFATGVFLNLLDFQIKEGELWPGPVPLPLKAQIQVQGYGPPLPVLYQGSAPGLINGVVQINVQLPQGQQNPALTISPESPGVVVYTRNP